ncbi:MAG: AI-2E family transporter [Clostridia bacterium]|nr:AI-2E family transporter [Clostridia bacterium]
MKQDTRRFIQILILCLASVLAFLAVFKAGVLLGTVKGIFAAISPIIAGACVAFTLNVLLSVYEKRLPEKFLAKLGKGKRLFCVVLTLFTVTALLSVFVLLIYPELKETVLTVVSNIPGYAAALIAYAAKVTGKTESELFEGIDINWESVAATISDFISGYGEKLLSNTIGITGNVLVAMLGFCVSIAFAVWILMKKEALGAHASKLVNKLFPKRADSIIRLARYSADVFSGFIGGQLAEALTIGVLCFLGMLIFGFPYALTASAIIMIFALVPVFGAIVGAILAALLMLTESFATAIWFLIYILVLQQLESNIIYPKLMGESVGLPGLWVLVAVTIGGDLFGAVGMLTAVPVFAILFTVFNALLDKRIEAKKKKAAELAANTEK